MKDDPGLSEMVELIAFGQKLSIAAPRYQFLRSDSLWRLRHIYQPALASQTLASTGTALDIGAGFGVFALPFALAFPNWTVYCFEPDPKTFSFLSQNIINIGLTNIVALPVGVGFSSADATPVIEKVIQLLIKTSAGSAQSVAGLTDFLPLQHYSRSLTNPGYVERGKNPSEEYELFEAPTISASSLTALAPNLLKLIAPKVEGPILADLRCAPLDHVIGESWSHISSSLVSSNTSGLRQIWIPRAGQSTLSLRRSLDSNDRPSQLDIIIAMQNSGHRVLNCLSAILDGSQNEIRVIVVDDGSTDGSSGGVNSIYVDDPRVSLFRKIRGGHSSAWNFGRMHSKAMHIAFVAADAIPSPNFFTGLLDLARHTGAEIVQGGFHLLADEVEEGSTSRPSVESEDERLKSAVRCDFGDTTCHLLPSAFLMEGQTSIWRRVYRRDFLENRKIWFPEHIKSVGDHIFQVLTLQSVGDVPILDGISYGHRQSVEGNGSLADNQDFYQLEMFRILLKRGVREGWSDFTPLLKSFAATVNYKTAKMSPSLRIIFVKVAAELWAYAQKTLGAETFGSIPYSEFEPIDFEHYARFHLEKLKSFGESYGWAYLDALDLHVPFLNLAWVR